MRRILVRVMFPCLLLALASATSAQQLRIESKGQAAEGAEQAAKLAVALSETLGLPKNGKAQVVLFRTPKSPGDDISLSGDGKPLGELPAGHYLPVSSTAGTHVFGTDTTALTLNVDAGKTYFVQVTRDRTGRPHLLRSTATSFQRVVK